MCLGWEVKVLRMGRMNRQIMGREIQARLVLNPLGVEILRISSSIPLALDSPLTVHRLSTIGTRRTLMNPQHPNKILNHWGS